MKDGQRPGPKAEGAGVVVTAGDGASNIQKAEENQSPTAGRGGLIRVCDAWNDDRVLGVFFLHVTTRGEELRFKTDPPDLKTLRVEIVETLGGLVEETRTYDARTSPSLIPLSLRHASTFGVILTKALRVGTSNHSSFR